MDFGRLLQQEGGKSIFFRHFSTAFFGGSFRFVVVVKAEPIAGGSVAGTIPTVESRPCRVRALLAH